MPTMLSKLMLFVATATLCLAGRGASLDVGQELLEAQPGAWVRYGSVENPETGSLDTTYLEEILGTGDDRIFVLRLTTHQGDEVLGNFRVKVPLTLLRKLIELEEGWSEDAAERRVVEQFNGQDMPLLVYRQEFELEPEQGGKIVVEHFRNKGIPLTGRYKTINTSENNEVIGDVLVGYGVAHDPNVTPALLPEGEPEDMTNLFVGLLVEHLMLMQYSPKPEAVPAP